MICIPKDGKLESLSLFYLDCERFYMQKECICASVHVAWVCQRAKMFLALFECVRVGKIDLTGFQQI